MTNLKRWEENNHWVEIDLDLCKASGECVNVCPVEVYEIINGKVNADNIFDCIEFNDRFRYSDTASDLAFLLMDLDFHGGEKFSKAMFECYQKYSGEKTKNFELVVNFYKVYRAYVRGKVNSFQLDDANISDAKKDEAKERAQKYFELASSYVNY